MASASLTAPQFGKALRVKQLVVQAHRRDGLPIVHGMRINSFTDAEEATVGLTQIVLFALEARLRELGANFEGAANWQPFAVRDVQSVTSQHLQSSGLVAQHVIEALSLLADQQAV